MCVTDLFSKEGERSSSRDCGSLLPDPREGRILLEKLRMHSRGQRENSSSEAEEFFHPGRERNISLSIFKD